MTHGQLSFSCPHPTPTQHAARMQKGHPPRQKRRQRKTVIHILMKPGTVPLSPSPTGLLAHPPKTRQQQERAAPRGARGRCTGVPPGGGAPATAWPGARRGGGCCGSPAQTSGPSTRDRRPPPGESACTQSAAPGPSAHLRLRQTCRQFQTFPFGEKRLCRLSNKGAQP